jgi:hypothetical protein
MLAFLSPIILLFDRNRILSVLWSSWTSFWYYCCVMDHYILLSIYNFLSIILGPIRDFFPKLSQLIEKHVTVEFFIYFIFFPIAIIPSILINHAGHYTLPYSCQHSRIKSNSRSRSSRGQGYHLARYYANLRNRPTIIHHYTTTFKGDHHNRNNPHHDNHSYSSKSTSISSDSIPSPIQRCFSADEQVEALIATNPSVSLDLFLFEAKLFWDSIPHPSHITTVFPSKAIDIFLISVDALDHYRTIQSLLPSSQYKSIDPSSLQFQRILLEARGLQTSINRIPVIRYFTRIFY